MKKFFNKFKYIIIAVLLLVIIFISYLNYHNTKEIIKDKYNDQQEFVETNILHTVNHVSDAYKIAEKQLNQEMKKYSLMLKAKYRRNPNIAEWNLKRLKDEFEGYNIYIINKKLKVIRSTFKPDVGLDFSKFPGFASLLRKRIKGDEFRVDRLDLSTKTGELKKYSYMPTPDHKYLLELSIDVKDKFPSLEDLSMFANAVELTNRYDSAEEISFYKFNPNNKTVGKLRNTKKPYITTDISEEESNLVRKAFVTKKEQSTVVKTKDNHYSSKYIPILVPSSEEEDSWWNSFVIGIKYNNQKRIQEIRSHRTLFIINALIIIIVVIVFILVMMHLLQRFEYLAYHDQLTGLPNRDSMAEKVNELKADAKKENNKLAILFLDLDDFKAINDNYGHDIGDKLLEAAANRLRTSLRKRDAVSRLGGDEFAIAIADINDKEELDGVATRIISAFAEPIMIDEKQIQISVSVGVSLYPDHGEGLEELIKKADYAMYKAKNEEEDLVVYQSQMIKE
ncbi:GGDEF domain-containing protein [Halanaerobacter jeridensis]|uniref:Diguanylate cyclase (GGDEF)-like protein n=1 Tax=Halanaerobacter jeridensis TaxID=706427 RepID=A0A939BNS2_9FIRM|nr:GGDEF domain-containing protein [Halanaerobacter jeridensis]MBM7555728.1 diguanylate cyclase (GGDEF)-like protein [Halanaerobacter jeridensis]